MNLHGEVRGAIQTVKPDILATWQQSTGFTTDAAGKRTPTYAADQSIRVQVQAASAGMLKHTNYANQQGVYRKVYAYGNLQGVVRVDLKGGDLLLFPQEPGGAAQTWLVGQVIETWDTDGGGWCCVLAVLQDD